MGYLRYKDYIGSVEYDEERICLCGKVQGMPKINIKYDGQSVAELTSNFHHAVDNYLERCKERCKSWLTIRMTAMGRSLSLVDTMYAMPTAA